jgi:hypothetical protein
MTHTAFMCPFPKPCKSEVTCDHGTTKPHTLLSFLLLLLAVLVEPKRRSKLYQ